MPTAILFPGQGSQTEDMREHVAAVRPDLLELVARAVGEDPFARAGEATRFAQPAIFCASLAGFGRLEVSEPAVHAGHSLGELTAFVAAGAISELDGLALVVRRAELMDAADEGTMIAALGGERDTVIEVAARHGLALANDNAPGQIVLSGAVPAAGAAAVDLREAGVRVLELAVAGAFHSPLMAPAVAPFADALAATEVRTPRVPVWSCVTAAPVEDPAEIRRVLAEGLTAPVRWRETVEGLLGEGIDTFTETGPGTVLTKLVKRCRSGSHTCLQRTQVPDPELRVHA